MEVLEQIKVEHPVFAKGRNVDEKIDELVRDMLELPAVSYPTYHHFVGGFYVRELHAPKGSVLVSKIHNTTHQYMLLRGDVSIYTKETGWFRIKGPVSNFTLAGTQRVGLVHEDMVWTTAHPATETTVEEVQKRVYDHYVNPLLNEEQQKKLDELMEFHMEGIQPNLMEEQLCQALQ